MGQLRNPHPGEILKEEFLIPMGKTQGELAAHLGCDVKVINRIVNGRTSVIAEMALKTLQINPGATPLSAELQKKHFFRKHGRDAYYGQGG